MEAFDPELTATFDVNSEPAKAYSKTYYPNENVVLGVATYSTSPGLSEEDIASVKKDLRSRGILSAMRTEFHQLNRIPLEVTEFSELEAEPQVLFLYVNYSLAAGNLTVFYPGAGIEAGYDADTREWRRRGSHRKLNGEALSATRIYRDYSSDRPIISICRWRRGLDAKAEMTIVADLPIETPRAISMVFLLNMFVALVALAAFLSFYAKSNLPFQLYLGYASLWIVLTYLAMFLAFTLSEGLTVRHSEELAVRQMVTWLLPFVPSDTFLIIAGRALRSKPVRAFRKEFWPYLGMQWCFAATAVISSIFLPEAMLSNFLKLLPVAFSVYAIWSLGTNIGQSRAVFRSEDHENLMVSPIQVAIVAQWTLYLWAGSQVGQVALGEAHPLGNGLQDTLVQILDRSDLIFSGIGAYTALAYLKILAFGMCVAYCAVRETAHIQSIRRTGTPNSFLRVSGDGLILKQGTGFGSEFANLEGRNLLDYVDEGPIRKELAGAINGDHPLFIDLQVQLLAPFPPQEVSLAVQRELTGTVIVAFFLINPRRAHSHVDLTTARREMELIEEVVTSVSQLSKEGEAKKLEKSTKRLLSLFGDSFAPTLPQPRHTPGGDILDDAVSALATFQGVAREVSQFGCDEVGCVVHVGRDIWCSILEYLLADLSQCALVNGMELGHIKLMATIQPEIPVTVKPKRLIVRLAIEPALDFYSSPETAFGGAPLLARGEPLARVRAFSLLSQIRIEAFGGENDASIVEIAIPCLH